MPTPGTYGYGVYGASLYGGVTPSLTFALTIEAAFGYGPGDVPAAWTDISSYGRGFSWQRGRQNELGQMQTGTATLTLKDPDSDFDPDNPDSPFYPDVRPGTPCRVYLTVSGLSATVYPLFYGTIERIPRTHRVTTVYTERQVDLVDGFAVLANATLAGFSFPVETSGERIDRVLDAVGWPSAARSLDTGQALINGKTFPPDDATASLSHILTVNDDEHGFVFVTGAGDVVFLDRLTLLQDAAYTTPAAEFRDAQGTTGYEYLDLVRSYDIDQVINKVIGTREGSEDTQTAEDSASQAQFFTRAKQFQSLLITDGELAQSVAWTLDLFKDPLNRVESIVTMPLRDSQDEAQIEATLGREIGDRVTIDETPPGFAAETSIDYTIQHLQGQIETGPLTSMRMTFGLWPAVDRSTAWWLVGTAGRSEIGSTTVVGY